jgi:hypothetical protein
MHYTQLPSRGLFRFSSSSLSLKSSKAIDSILSYIYDDMISPSIIYDCRVFYIVLYFTCEGFPFMRLGSFIFIFVFLFSLDGQTDDLNP